MQRLLALPSETPARKAAGPAMTQPRLAEAPQAQQWDTNVSWVPYVRTALGILFTTAPQAE